MAAAATLTDVQGWAPAGAAGGSSRRRNLAMALVFALGAATAGALLGILAQPPHSDGRLEQAIATAGSATEVARRATDHAKQVEAQLAQAKARIDALDAMGAAQELADFEEAQRLGLTRYMKESPAMWGDERRHVLAAIVRESRRNGLDPALTAAVIQVESRFDPFAVSHVGACGLMQLMPPTAQWLLQNDDKDDKGVPRIKPAHLFNPILNIELGTMYLADLLQRFDGDLNQALIAYNAGPGVARSLKRNSRAWKRLSAYPKSVLAAYRTILTPPAEVAAR
jgi:soluble lytic murein transglycosylase-like protein